MFDFQRNRQEITELIRAHGLTPTAQRVAIGEVLLNKPQHLCAEEVLQKVNAGANNASKATVYNTLKSFLKHGLIQEVKINDQTAIYDSVTESHHHFYNEDTGELSDIKHQDISINYLPELPPELETKGVDILVRIGNKTATR